MADVATGYGIGIVQGHVPWLAMVLTHSPKVAPAIPPDPRDMAATCWPNAGPPPGDGIVSAEAVTVPSRARPNATQEPIRSRLIGPASPLGEHVAAVFLPGMTR